MTMQHTTSLQTGQKVAPQNFIWQLNDRPVQEDAKCNII
jgi:hypothetical protein